MYKRVYVSADGNCFYHALHLALGNRWKKDVGKVPGGSIAHDHVRHLRSFFRSKELEGYIDNQLAANVQLRDAPDAINKEQNLDLDVVAASSRDELYAVLTEDARWAEQVAVGLIQKYLFIKFGIALMVSHDESPPDVSEQPLMDKKFGLFSNSSFENKVVDENTEYCFLYHENDHFWAWVPLARELPKRDVFFLNHKKFAKKIEYADDVWDHVVYVPNAEYLDDGYDGVSFEAGVAEKDMVDLIEKYAKNGGVVVVRGRFFHNVATVLRGKKVELTLNRANRELVEYTVRRAEGPSRKLPAALPPGAP